MKTRKNFEKIIDNCNNGNWKDAAKLVIKCGFSVKDLVDFNSEAEENIGQFDSPYDIAYLIDRVMDIKTEAHYEIADEINARMNNILNKDITLEQVSDFDAIMNDIDGNAEMDFSDNELVYNRLCLIIEEVFELIEACGFDGYSPLKEFIYQKVHASKAYSDTIQSANPVEALDALVDLRYVCDFFTNGVGLKSKFKKGFGIIHKNNMTKVCLDLNEAQKTKKYYSDNYGVVVDIITRKRPEGTYYVIKCNHDPNGKWKKGKILKPIDYQKVDLKSLF